MARQQQLEKKLQEALDKQAELDDLPLTWHFIGPIQSNKTKAIAEHFDWVHSVDRLKIAQRLSDQRPAALPPPMLPALDETARLLAAWPSTAPW